MSTAAPRGEFDLIAAVRARVAARPVGPGVVLGIGDDAALLAPPAGHEIVATCDLLIEGCHFVANPTDAGAFDIGRKALAVSVSDIAAMGGRARWALVSVALPAGRAGAFADGLTEGLLACADRHGVALVGGDTTSSPGPVVVAVTLLGTVPAGRAVRRDGARVGDAICVTGALGGSLGPGGAGRHLRPEPRQDAAAALVQGGDVHAMIDLSDGLSSDLGHVLDASGVGAVVWASRVPLHDDAVAAAARDGRSALCHAFDDGEDFELLFTLPVSRAGRLVDEGLCGVPVAWIGAIVAAGGCEVRESPDDPGPGIPLARGGHDHFRPAR